MSRPIPGKKANLSPHLVKKIADALADKKGINIRVLDVRELVSYTDFLVLCSGTSSTHVNALVSSVEEACTKEEGPVYVNPSKDDSWWILDFVEVVVHVFREETRTFYDLERLWCDAQSLDL